MGGGVTSTGVGGRVPSALGPVAVGAELGGAVFSALGEFYEEIMSKV